MDWKDFLPGLAPRADLDEPFAADSYEVDKPALLTNNPVLTAAAVGSRLLEILALRGATRVKPSSAEKLRRLVWRALPEPAAHLCDDEAARILRWLTEPTPAAEREGQGGEPSETPEVDIMFDADIESRISVAEFAIDEDYDLELEYLDTQAHIWPRIRCTPVEVTTHEPADATGEPILRVESDFGELEIPIHQIRWLMPVSSHQHRRAQGTKKPAGKLLNFPTGDE